MNDNILVVYFSAGGNTARAAREIAGAVEGHIREIVPAMPYSAADLDWTDRTSRTSREMNDASCRPQTASEIDISSYDTIFLGFPIWWYTEPRIIDTFLEEHDFSGKIVIPFATSGGSGISGAENRMIKICPDATWQKGAIVNTGAAAWAKRAIK